MLTFIKFRESFEQASADNGVEQYCFKTYDLLSAGPVNNDMHIGQSLDFVAYPNQPIYDASELNRLLFKLCPFELLPSAVFQFEDTGFSLRFGRIQFFETIGKIQHSLSTTFLIDDSSGLLPEPEPSTSLIERALTRRVIVSLFPSREIAEALCPRNSNDDVSETLNGISLHLMSGQFYQEWKAKSLPSVAKRKGLFRKLGSIFSKAA